MEKWKRRWALPNLSTGYIDLDSHPGSIIRKLEESPRK